MPSDTRGYYSAVTDIAGSFSSELASHPRPLQVASLSDKGGLLLLNMPKNTHFCYIAKYLFCSMVSSTSILHPCALQSLVAKQID